MRVGEILTDLLSFVHASNDIGTDRVKCDEKSIDSSFCYFFKDNLATFTTNTLAYIGKSFNNYFYFELG